VFKRRLIAQNQYRYRDRLVKPAAITDIALFTVEGAEDDITGLGQTEAAQDLLTGLPKSERMHYTQKDVGHYGVFNGSRWRQSIQPRVRDFIHEKRRTVS
jgi:poly(3-hydroxybutyrate) depolymerase